ncbi:MAG: THUMP domain-containing protein [Candidatus Njordarchaeota archaeon]
MKAEGLLFSYRTVPRDLGAYAVEDVRKFLEKIQKKFPILQGAEVLHRPEGVKGYVFVDLRPAFESIPEDKAVEITSSLISAIKEAFDRGELMSIARVRIIHKIANTDIESISKVTKEIFADKIKGKWKIEIHTRKIIDRIETIKAVGSHIDKPVDLKNPEYVLHIEVLGRKMTLLYLVYKPKEDDVIIRI